MNIIQKLNDKLQMIAHSGHAQTSIKVKVGENLYEIKDVIKENGEFVIIAK